MSSYSENGQEFIQGIFKSGQSFGEPAIFGDFPYPNNAIATENSEIARLPKDVFYELLQEHFEIHQKFTSLFSNRLRYKAILLKEISSYCPDHVIMTLLKYLRDNSDIKDKAQFYIPFTRQQIADMTGLRVETVIRTVKKLQKEGKLEIKQHKIYLAWIYHIHFTGLIPINSNQFGFMIQIICVTDASHINSLLIKKVSFNGI